MWHEWREALKSEWTYRPFHNGWAMFGFLWGLPIPILAFLISWKTYGSVLQVVGTWPVHIIPLLHPLFFMVVFGAVGTVLRKKDLELRASLETTRYAATTDPLTGLRNRRYLTQRLTEEIERSRRTGDRIACVMMDLDGFKPVNDRHGHPAGDQVLTEVARRLNRMRRDYDLVARYGGDEFVFILPKTGRDAAERFAERLLKEIGDAGYGVTGTDELQRVTASIGVAMFPDDGEMEIRLLAAADKAMYDAKINGRNRVCFAGGCPAQVA